MWPTVTRVAQKSLEIIKRHKLIIANALVMAVLVISPAILFPIMSGKSYQGINIGNFADDDIGYYSKGKEIIEGHSLGNYTLKIGKEGQNPHGVYIEYLLLIPLKILGLSAQANIVTIYNIYQTLGIFLLILLIYIFVLQFSPDKLLATATAIFVIGGYNFVISYPIKMAVFNTDINIYSRPVMPFLSSICFFAFLILLVKSLRQNEWRWTIMTGLALGALFYVYPFAWSFALAAAGVLFILGALKRDAVIIKKIVAIILIALAVGGYQLWQMYTFSQSAQGKQFAFFANIHTDHQPAAPSKLTLVALIIFAVFAYKHKKDNDRLILLALLLAGIVALNQQVITGRSVQILHYFWYFVIPLDIIVSFVCLNALFSDPKYKLPKTIALVVLILLAQSRTIIQQYEGTQKTFPFKQGAQNYGPIVTALNKFSEPGVILFSDKYYGSLFSVYTTHDLFWTRNVYEFNTPIQRLKDALFVYTYVDTRSRHNFVGYLSDDSAPSWHDPVENSRDIFNNLVSCLAGTALDLDANTYHLKLAAGDPLVVNKTQGTIKGLNQEYEKLIENPKNITSLLKQDAVNFIVWDKNQNPDWDLSFMSGLTEVTNANNIYLYRL